MVAAEARRTAQDLDTDPLEELRPVGAPSMSSLEALCEWLAEFYVEAGETLPSQAARDRAQAHAFRAGLDQQVASQAARDRAQALATAAIKRLALVRHLADSAS